MEYPESRDGLVLFGQQEGLDGLTHVSEQWVTWSEWKGKGIICGGTLYKDQVKQDS